MDINITSIISLLSGTSIAIAGLILAERRHKEQLLNERKSKEEELNRERQRLDLHRENMPLLQFEMELGTVQTKKDKHLAEFLLVISNQGNIKQDIKSISLRVRSIKHDDDFSIWKGNGHRAEFPNKEFEVDIIPKGYGFIFVEPNVRQSLSYTTILDGDVEVVSARAEFSYGKARKGSRGSKHSVERIYSFKSEPDGVDNDIMALP